MTLKVLLKEFQSDEGGATAIEYGLVVGIVTACIITIFGSGAALSGLYNTIEAVVFALA